jgi:hypothetical protein
VERRDLLTDGLTWVESAFPAVQQGLSAISKDGKIGPFPTAPVLVVALALLLLLLRQFWPATMLIAALLALQWLPRLVTKLTASERADPDAVQVTGPARLRRRRLDPFGEVFELAPANGVTLRLEQDAYWRLLRATGVPIDDQPYTATQPVTLPGFGTVPAAPRIVEQPLPAVIVTYLSTNRLLFDVRAADGTVLVRHPQYAGEPGDDLLTPSSAEPATADAAWRPAGRGRQQALRLPVEAKAALQAGFTSAQTRVMVQIGLPVVLVILTISSSFMFFAFVVAVVIVFLAGGPPVTRANLLRVASQADSMVRVAGPVRLTEHRMGKTRRYTLHLETGTTLPITFALRNELARLGTRQSSGDWTAHVGAVAGVGPEQLVREDEVPALTVTHEPTAPLLLAIQMPDGASVYRDPALPPDALGEPTTTA